ncbi:hypothetical protein OPV22_031469 [Ensete ventricosum]|uniref:DUF4228 domain-containing protein n=1 Tax=Ensete ventricosum TaxID=4639 RepID=A0AAV8PP69_ENSVE|nr:hypothetical protein OPV22_031469 [Ensete ventricosum]
MVTRDAIKCCVSCILPCGALDVIRIVHVSGRVEEISFANTAGDIMQAHPKYVLRKPPPSALSGGVEAPKVMTLPPNAELQRGKKYFLMPVAVPAPEKARFDAKETRRRKKKGGDSKIVMRLQPIRLCFLTRDRSSHVVADGPLEREGRGGWGPLVLDVLSLVSLVLEVLCIASLRWLSVLSLLAVSSARPKQADDRTKRPPTP